MYLTGTGFSTGTSLTSTLSLYTILSIYWILLFKLSFLLTNVWCSIPKLSISASLVATLVSRCDFFLVIIEWLSRGIATLTNFVFIKTESFAIILMLDAEEMYRGEEHPDINPKNAKIRHNKKVLDILLIFYLYAAKIAFILRFLLYYYQTY